MSFNVLSTLELNQINQYLAITMVTAMGYDYVLTFSREMDYIWHRSWTWVSTIFVLVRYVGLCWIMTSGLLGSTFIPGPLEVNVRDSFITLRNIKTRLGRLKGSGVFLVSLWAFAVFLSAADVVMILRVYAMWNRSKTILYILLLVYAVQTVTTVVFIGMATHADAVEVTQVLDFTFCSVITMSLSPTLIMFSAIPRFVLGATLMILAVSQTLKQSIVMYKATKQWQPNRYIQQLVRDGILYFLANLLYQIVVLIKESGVQLYGASTLFLGAIIFYPLVPRLIISVRELYERDLHDRWQGIDTGFGVLSQPTARRTQILSAIEFVDVTLDQMVEDPRVDQFEVGEEGVHPV